MIFTAAETETEGKRRRQRKKQNPPVRKQNWLRMRTGNFLSRRYFQRRCRERPPKSENVLPIKKGLRGKMQDASQRMI